MTGHGVFRKTLLALHEVVVSLQDGSRLGPLNWGLSRAERVWVDCARPGQWETLVDVLTEQKEFQQGALEEPIPVKVQTDAHLWESLNLNQSINDYLRSPDAPQFVWLENRRRALWVLVELLGLAPYMLRQPLRMEAPEVLEKYWALRFLVSRAELLIGNAVFRLEDPHVRSAFRKRWADLPGAVIVGAPWEALPGAVDTVIRIDAQGRLMGDSDPGPPPPS